MPPGCTVVRPMRGPRNSGASGRESSRCSSTHRLRLSVKLDARVLLIFDISEPSIWAAF